MATTNHARLTIFLISALGFLAFVSTAAAASPPGAATGSASSIGTTTAHLNGYVNPAGQSTNWYFQYGTTTGYGVNTSEKNAGSGTRTVTESAALAGLAAGTTYHFRLVASNGTGTTLGPDRSFTTAGPPAVETGGAQGIGANAVTLTGAVNPGGQSTNWLFELGTTTGYGTKTAVKNIASGTTAVGVSMVVTGLAPGTTYHYRLVVANSSGIRVGADQAFATLGPPAVQTGVTQNIAATTVTVTGAINPGGLATTWHFDVGPTSSYGAATPSETLAAGTSTVPISAPVASLAPGTAYHYRLVATSAGGTTYGADMSFTTAPAVTLQAAQHVVSGNTVALSGIVGGNAAGVTVTVLAQTYGTATPVSIGTVVSDGSGAWLYLARPKLQTSYLATVSTGTSPAVTVGVAPSVSLRQISGGRFKTHLGAGSSLVNRKVQLQVHRNGKWVTVASARLDSHSTAIFSATSVPAGTSTVRIAVSVNQAGAGLLAGFSRPLAYSAG